MSLALQGVLASPTRRQKSSLGLIAQQTAAEAEWRANVALLGRKAKEAQGKGLCGRPAPAAVGEDRWPSTPALPLILEVGNQSPRPLRGRQSNAKVLGIA